MTEAELNKWFLAAARRGEFNALKQSVEQGADINAIGDGRKTALHYLAIINSLEGSRYLCELGIDINACDNLGWTALHWVAMNDNAALVRYLIDRGTDIAIKDMNGNTALDIAVDSQRIEAAALIRAFANARNEMSSLSETISTKNLAVTESMPIF